MKLTLAGLPYVPLSFRKDGFLADPQQPLAPLAHVDDLLVLSHGWHQDPDDAEQMYEAISRHFLDSAHATLSGRKIGILGVYWPSDQFRNDLSSEDVAVLANGRIAKSTTLAAVTPQILQATAVAVAQLLEIEAHQLTSTASLAASGIAAEADNLVSILRAAIGGAGGDSELLSDHHLLLDERLDGRDIVARLPAMEATHTRQQLIERRVAKGAALAPTTIASAKIAWILNQAAYFALKKRAGLVGVSLGRLLDSAPSGEVSRIHLVGHSFGGRLVTAAVSAMRVRRPYSLCLLQAAFSHNGFGVNVDGCGLNGAFRSVIDEEKVSGPIVITHTWNDVAVGLLYAAASRASRDISKGLVRVTQSFGGADDRFGGMGANGARLLKPGESCNQSYDGNSMPSLTAKVNNLRCDFIRDHNDVRTVEIGRLLAAAMH